MIAADPIPVELRGYLHELIAAIGSVADLDGVYLLGSAALGAYQHRDRVRGEIEARR